LRDLLFRVCLNIVRRLSLNYLSDSEAL